MTQITIQQAFALALQHHQAGRLNNAARLYRQVLDQQPKHADAWHYLGVIAYQQGEHDRAVDLIRQAIALRPDLAAAYDNLGNALQAKECLDEAIAAWRQAIALQPNSPGAYNNLGNVLKETGQLDQAIAAYRQALALRPDYPEAHSNLGNALQAQGRLDEAILVIQQAITLRPNYAEAYSNLGNALQARGQLDEAVAAYHQAIAFNPNYSETHNNLGNVLKAKGCLDEAIAAYQQGLARQPDSFAAHSNLIYALHYHAGTDANALAQECRRWNQQHAAPLQPYIRPHANDRNAERRLRIGYVSPDFRQHPVGRFLLPLLANHDHQCVEIFAYPQVPAPDAVTAQLRGHTDVWRSLVGLADVQAAKLIHQDGIDILVDLALHTANNRLRVFACKPAPVQVTWLGYPGSTGLTAMDYRLSDPYLDPFDTAQGGPPGGDESIYSEKTICLPQTYWCYQPVVEVPLQPPPGISNGFITFGCLNNFCKVNGPLLNLWTKLLGAVPTSRLLLHAHAGSHQAAVWQQMQREGIDPQRVSFVGKSPTRAYFERYQSIDIALDTHPYGGGTTTCDALWMGVPVVSLAGKTAVGRAGLSILTNLGLPELVGKTPEEYIQIAIDLANDLPRLKQLRLTLRPRMTQSPLMDAPRFARNVEAMYRQMWRKWCESCPS